MPSLESAALDYGDFTLDDERLVVVHLLLFGPSQGVPTVEDARAWAEHFGYEDSPNHVVLVGNEDMQGPASYAMVPGFQLVDTTFQLRLDGAGRSSKHDLWTNVLPSVPTLLAE